jgi:hypothetical protein
MIAVSKMERKNPWTRKQYSLMTMMEPCFYWTDISSEADRAPMDGGID